MKSLDYANGEVSDQVRTVDTEEMQVTAPQLVVRVKVKFSIEQATKAQTGSRGIALLFP